MLAHMNQEECAAGLNEIAGISESIFLPWSDFPTGPAIKAYKYYYYYLNSILIRSVSFIQ